MSDLKTKLQTLVCEVKGNNESRNFEKYTTLVEEVKKLATKGLEYLVLEEELNQEVKKMLNDDGLTIHSGAKYKPPSGLQMYTIVSWN